MRTLYYFISISLIVTFVLLLSYILLLCYKLHTTLLFLFKQSIIFWRDFEHKKNSYIYHFQYSLFLCLGPDFHLASFFNFPDTSWWWGGSASLRIRLLRRRNKQSCYVYKNQSFGFRDNDLWVQSQTLLQSSGKVWTPSRGIQIWLS